MGKPIRQKSIYMCDFSGAKGSEEKGLRPALVVQNNVGNDYSPITWVVPITSKDKKDRISHHMLFREKYGFLEYKENTVLCEQLTTKDMSRISRYVGTISDFDFDIVIKKIKDNMKQYNK